MKGKRKYDLQVQVNSESVQNFIDRTPYEVKASRTVWRRGKASDNLKGLPIPIIPLGLEVHNVELRPGGGGQLARSAGTVAQIVAKEGNGITLRLPSGEVRLVSKNCWATIGQVGNTDSINLTTGKAGRMRWLGRRPTVRGVVMNPVDHPHGGGEGRAPIGRSRPVTPWGRPALGQRTRKNRKYSHSLIIRRRKSFT